MYNCNKLLIITPHLSTGGSPQYLLEFIKKYKNNFNEIKVVEYSIFSTDYIVQKEKIKKIIGEENLISLGFLYEPEIIFTENRKKLVTLIETYEPDIIWMNESPENYEYRAPLLEVTEIIYSKNRKHKIIETTHNNAFDFNQKIFIPDEFLFCSNKHIKDSQSIVIPKKVWDIPIENKQRPDRKKTLLELGLCPEKLHVLNVGLFNTNKNQKYIFEIAKKLPNVEFHFVGNTCFLEECCINEDLNLDNCTIWGERNDVDKFMSCMDIFLFPSRKELNPISVKEALSWGMEVIANRDRNYTDQYLGLKNFILIDQIDVIKYIKERNKFNDINITFKNGVTVEILGEHRNEYHIKFYNRDNGELIHEGVIYNNMWIKPNPQYFVNWRIDIYMNGSKILEKNLNLKGKKILISYESKSLGDSIAWVPYVEEFRKKHDCEVYCATFRNFLFEKSYPNIKFVNVGMNEDEFYANYRLGWFFDTNKNPNDVRLIPLQKTASDILGLNFKEIKTKIDFNPNFENTYGKYITLSTHSTSQCKYWNKIGGWDNIIKYLNQKGYNVVCVDQYYYFGSNELMNSVPERSIKEIGQDFDKVMQLIYHSEFHMGLGSGDCWLAWGLGKKVLMVSSFSKPFCEFQESCYRVYREGINSGFFNNLNMRFDPSKWNWNPIKDCKTFEDWDSFEPIEIEDVITKIDELLL
jgi:autotransporter strand-loop-strand O-heptosyltransferase